MWASEDVHTIPHYSNWSKLSFISKLQLENDTDSCCLHLALQAASLALVASLQHLDTCSDRQIDAFPGVCVNACVCYCAFRIQCVCGRVFESLTLAAAQVLDLDAFLFLTGRLLHLAGVVVRMAIWGAHRVEADVGTVNVANTPKEQEMGLEQ